MVKSVRSLNGSYFGWLNKSRNGSKTGQKVQILDTETSGFWASALHISPVDSIFLQLQSLIFNIPSNGSATHLHVHVFWASRHGQSASGVNDAWRSLLVPGLDRSRSFLRSPPPHLSLPLLAVQGNLVHTQASIIHKLCYLLSFFV